MDGTGVFLIHGQKRLAPALLFAIVQGLADQMAANALSLVGWTHRNFPDPDDGAIGLIGAIEPRAHNPHQFAIGHPVAQDGGFQNVIGPGKPAGEPCHRLAGESPALPPALLGDLRGLSDVFLG